MTLTLGVLDVPMCSYLSHHKFILILHTIPAVTAPHIAYAEDCLKQMFSTESICFHSRRYWMLRPMQISSYLILFSCVIYVCAKCELEWDSFVTQVLLPMRNDDAMKREKTLEIRTRNWTCPAWDLTYLKGAVCNFRPPASNE